ncbi:hypothetical protein CBS101457_003931 [Exobasidium rhododendri]|nr:hypothetical protein CBS101457_003931 [Exobasidium rhododendri]
MTSDVQKSLGPEDAKGANILSAEPKTPIRTPLNKRTVSFSPTSDTGESSILPSLGSAATPSSSAMTPTNSIGGTPSALKPALKAGTDRKKLPPTSQYQHPDPLLRRLRLVDNLGNPVELQSLFKGVKVVAFYFSSQWAGQPLKEYHQTISDFARERHKEFKVVYVSVDVDEQWYKAGVKGQPWVSMVWNDGSSSPAPPSNANISTLSDSDEPPALYNNEDFLMAQEADIDESLAKTDTSGQAYLRPFSRVHLASKLNIIAAPTLCIYHIEKQKMLDWNVRMARLSQYRKDETWARWRRGEMAKSVGFSEAIGNAPYTFALAVIALCYYLLLLLGGQKYNVSGNAAQQVVL